MYISYMSAGFREGGEGMAKGRGDGRGERGGEVDGRAPATTTLIA